MASITLRGSLTRPLTSTELDNNFSNIKAELDPISGSTNSVTQTLSNKTISLSTITDTKISGTFQGYLQTGGFIDPESVGGLSSGYFNGSATSSYLSMSSSSMALIGTGDFTVDFWFRHTMLSATTAKIFSVGNDSSANNFQLLINPESGGTNTTFTVVINNSSVQYQITQYGPSSSGLNPYVLVSASWNYFAISRVNGVVNVYLNGIRLKETGGAALSTQAGQIGPGSGSTTLTIGAGTNGTTTSSYYSGQLVSFRINIGVGLYNGDYMMVPNGPSVLYYSGGTLYTKLLLYFNGSGSTIVDSSFTHFSITNNNVSQNNSELPIYLYRYGTRGQVLTNTGYGVQWADISILPAQRSSNSGQFLTTDGTKVSWATINALPTQTGNSGKYLTTDGTTATWATISALPTQTGNSGKFLTTNGTTASWATTGDVTLTGTQTLTNKTLTSPTLTGTITLPLVANAAGNSTVGGGLFSGSAYATVADAAALQPGTGDFTVEFWMRADSGGTTFNGRVFGKGNYATSGNLQLEYSGGTSNLLVHINGAYSTYTSPVTMSNGTWYYIAISRVSGTVYVYVNGQRSGSGTLQSGNINSTGAFYVGGSGDGAYFKGNITNFRYIVGTGLYSGATHTVPTTELTAVTNTQLLMLFDNGTSATLQDHSGNNRTITNISVTQDPSYIPTAWAGSTGTNGQVLQSTGTGLQWATVSAGGGTTTNALTIGTGLSGTSFNGSSAVTIAIDSTVATLTGTQTLTNKTLTSPTINSATTNNLTLTGTLTAGGGVGNSGQYLQSTGTGVQWATVAAGGGDVTLTGTQTLTNKTLTSPTISSPTITGTLTAGGGVGANGQVLQSTGTGVVWATPSGGSGSATLNFDFGGFVRIFTDPVLYLLDKIGMDHGTFASPTEPSVNAGTF